MKSVDSYYIFMLPGMSNKKPAGKYPQALLQKSQTNLPKISGLPRLIHNPGKPLNR